MRTRTETSFQVYALSLTVFHHKLTFQLEGERRQEVIEKDKKKNDNAKGCILRLIKNNCKITELIKIPFAKCHSSERHVGCADW